MTVKGGYIHIQSLATIKISKISNNIIFDFVYWSSFWDLVLVLPVTFFVSSKIDMAGRSVDVFLFLFIFWAGESVRTSLGFGSEFGVVLFLAVVVVLLLLLDVDRDPGLPSSDSMASDGSKLLRVLRRRRLPEREDEIAVDDADFLLLEVEALDTGIGS